MNDEARIISLVDSLPCAIQRDGQQCGRAAYVALAWRLNAPSDMPMWAHLEGCWALQPVCRGCAAEMAKVYEHGA